MASPLASDSTRLFNEQAANMYVSARTFCQEQPLEALVTVVAVTAIACTAALFVGSMLPFYSVSTGFTAASLMLIASITLNLVNHSLNNLPEFATRESVGYATAY